MGPVGTSATISVESFPTVGRATSIGNLGSTTTTVEVTYQPDAPVAKIERLVGFSPRHLRYGEFVLQVRNLLVWADIIDMASSDEPHQQSIAARRDILDQE